METWIRDLRVGLITEVDLPTAIRKRKFNSKFLQAVANCYTRLRRREDYDQLTKYFPMLKHYIIGMESAMKLRPTPEDYDLVDYHLPLYVLHKAMFWPGQLSWYDCLNLYHVAAMLRRWGSLGLVSQEGMEGFQKVLNQIFRLGNGFANAGAVKHAIKDTEEEADYLAARKEKKSKAKWVYEQALLKDYPTLSDSLKRHEELENTAVTWDYYCRRIDRYSAGIYLVIKLMGTWRLRRARLQESTYYTNLLELYHSAWEGYPTKEELKQKSKFERCTLRTQRLLAYARLTKAQQHARLMPAFAEQVGRTDVCDDKPSWPFHALHPCRFTTRHWRN